MLACVEVFSKDIGYVRFVGMENATFLPRNLTQGSSQYPGMIVINQCDSTYSVCPFVIENVGRIVSSTDANFKDDHIDALPLR